MSRISLSAWISMDLVHDNIISYLHSITGHLIPERARTTKMQHCSPNISWLKIIPPSSYLKKRMNTLYVLQPLYIMYTPATFACQTRLGVQPRSPATFPTGRIDDKCLLICTQMCTMQSVVSLAHAAIIKKATVKVYNNTITYFFRTLTCLCGEQT